MTRVGSPNAQPARQPAQGPVQSRAQPAPADIRAMNEAFAKARLQGKEQPGQPIPQKGLKNLVQPDRRGDAPVQQREAFGDRSDTALRHEREARERQDGLFGFAGHPPQVLAMPAMPAAHVDPGAFAQMLADLWTRENGKGTREVTVTFGDRAWPATGARLVRNAAGTLDVALLLGDRAPPYDGVLRELEKQLQGAGIALGSLSTEATFG